MIPKYTTYSSFYQSCLLFLNVTHDPHFVVLLSVVYCSQMKLMFSVIPFVFIYRIYCNSHVSVTTILARNKHGNDKSVSES